MRKGLLGLLIGTSLLCVQTVSAAEMVRYEPMRVAATTKQTTSHKVSHQKKHHHHHAKKHHHHHHVHSHSHPRTDEFDGIKHHYKFHTKDTSRLAPSKRKLERIEDDLPMYELAPEHH